MSPREGQPGGLAGHTLRCQPILVIREGRVVPLERVRTAPKALARLAELGALNSVEEGNILMDNHSLIASDSEGNKKALENMARIVTR